MGRICGRRQVQLPSSRLTLSFAIWSPIRNVCEGDLQLFTQVKLEQGGEAADRPVVIFVAFHAASPSLNPESLIQNSPSLTLLILGPPRLQNGCTSLFHNRPPRRIVSLKPASNYCVRKMLHSLRHRNVNFFCSW
jgi:hypothetical protein